VNRSRRPPEVERDQLETSFTPILRRVYDVCSEVLAIIFVDVEGECVDYVSSIDPFECKVAGAHMLVLMHELRDRRHAMGMDEPVLLEITGAERELWGRRVSEEYLLVAVVLPECDGDRLRASLAAAGADFREEAGMPTPHWEPGRPTVDVVVRKAVGWAYAPVSFSEDGILVAISDVMGRWTEPGGVGGDELVCFRVRTREGHELTLVHDPDADGWVVRP
jgi:hypothetical protein